jgi:hypothetical protein
MPAFPGGRIVSAGKIPAIPGGRIVSAGKMPAIPGLVDLIRII